MWNWVWSHYKRIYSKDSLNNELSESASRLRDYKLLAKKAGKYGQATGTQETPPLKSHQEVL